MVVFDHDLDIKRDIFLSILEFIYMLYYNKIFIVTFHKQDGEAQAFG